MKKFLCLGVLFLGIFLSFDVITLKAFAANEGIEYFEIKQEEDYFLMNKGTLIVKIKNNEPYDKILPDQAKYITISVSKSKLKFPKVETDSYKTINKNSFSTFVNLEKSKEVRYVLVTIYNSKKKEINSQIEKISLSRNTVQINENLQEIDDKEGFSINDNKDKIFFNQKYFSEKYGAKYMITIGLTEKNQNVVTQLYDGIYFIEKINMKLGSTIIIEPFSLVKREAATVDLYIVLLDENLKQLGYLKHTLVK